MKRKSKKLTLSRETLTVMDESYLANLAGGLTLGCTRTACSNGCTGTLCSICTCGYDPP